MEAPKDPRGFENGCIYLYKLDDMTEEQIRKYGLTETYEKHVASKEVNNE